MVDIRCIGLLKNGSGSIIKDCKKKTCELDNPEAARELIDAMRLHYNFIHGNQAIGGQTPAVAEGINLNVTGNKTQQIMRQAALQAKDPEKEPVVKGLRIKINKVYKRICQDKVSRCLSF